MALAGSYLTIFTSQKYKINSEWVEQRVVLFIYFDRPGDIHVLYCLEVFLVTLRSPRLRRNLTLDQDIQLDVEKDIHIPVKACSPVSTV